MTSANSYLWIRMKYGNCIGLITWLSIGFFSCTEDHLPEVDDEVLFRLDSVVSTYDRSIFSYDVNHRLVEELYVANGDTIRSEYDWAGNGDMAQVRSVHSNGATVFTFRKEGPYWIQERFDDGVYAYFWKYTDRRIGIDTVWTTNGSGTPQRILKYWTNGNVDSITYSIMGQDSVYREQYGSKVFEYNGLQNPYINLPFEWRYVGTSILWGNNARNVYRGIKDNEQGETFSFVYDLDEYGLVSRMERNDNRGQEDLEQLFYYTILK